jgi:TRAP-type C4-dicarboxylate transport system permease small subunit
VIANPESRLRWLLHGLESWRLAAARVFGIIAAVFLAAMMLVTVADVVLRSFFNTPVRGVYELVELLLAYTFFVGLPAVFLRDENIVVNVIDGAAPRLVPGLRRLADILALVVLALMAWRGWLAAGDAVAFGDVTADLGLSRALHWAAVLIGVVGACLATLVMCLRSDLRR